MNASFHIYDNRRDYSLTNIRDILFNVDKKVDECNIDNDKGRSSRMNLFGKGGFGIRHFVTINLFLTTAFAHINKMSIHAAMPYMVNNTARRIHVILYRAGVGGMAPGNRSDDDSDDKESSESSDDEVSVINNKTNLNNNNSVLQEETDCPLNGKRLAPFVDGPFDWSQSDKRAAIYCFFYSYIPALIPASLIARRFGAKRVISTGFLVQSFFAMMIPMAAETGMLYLMIVRMIQGITLATVIPCIYMLLANWIPPCERSRMISVVLSGPILGGMLLNYLSQILCECTLCGGCAAHFYFFAACSVLLSMFFAFFMWEDPETCPVISDKERHYILSELGRLNMNRNVPPHVPWKSIAMSMPCWSLLLTEVAEDYFLNTAFCGMPLYMETVLHSRLASVELISTLPYVLMLTSGLLIAVVADCFILHNKLNTLTVRRTFNSIAQYGGAIGIGVIAHIGCNPNNTIIMLSVIMLINGANFSGFKVNYLDITHNFAGVLVAITNTIANVSSLTSYHVTLTIANGKKKLDKWQLIFFVAAIVLGTAATVFVLRSSAERQHWDIGLPTEGKSKSVTFMKDEPKKDIENLDVTEKENE